jgi:hypothetical protein
MVEASIIRKFRVSYAWNFAMSLENNDEVSKQLVAVSYTGIGKVPVSPKSVTRKSNHPISLHSTFGLAPPIEVVKPPSGPGIGINNMCLATTGSGNIIHFRGFAPKLLRKPASNTV